MQRVTDQDVAKTTTQEKWDKGKARLQKYTDAFAKEERPTHSFKGLQSDAGYFVHQAMTFNSLMPFLKGFFLTMNSWRSDRGEDGWKRAAREWEVDLRESLLDKHPEMEVHQALESLGFGLDEANEGTIPSAESPPQEVKAVPRMKTDVQAIEQMFSSAQPPVISVRSSGLVLAVYGFGDASGKGFGSAFGTREGLSYRIGIWTEEESEESSNWREFTNCIESLEAEAEAGHLTNLEVWFFTDNTTVEACFYRGSSSSPKLLALIIRLRALEMKYSVRLFVCHVAGTRMIAQGADGISRGALNEGVMGGDEMLAYLPLHKSALDVSSSLQSWICSWLGDDAVFLDPMGWYERGHDVIGWEPPQPWQHLETPREKPGKMVWTPPPAAASVALEELRKARLKRQASTHVFVAPRLLTTLWYKQLHKACDLVFEIPAGTSFWGAERFEPLTIGIVFPFIRNKPWQLRGCPKMFAVARQLSAMWKEDEVGGRDLLRKFCQQCWRLPEMPGSLVSRMLYFSSRDFPSGDPCGLRQNAGSG